MKRFLLIALIAFTYNLIAQDEHLSIVYDIDGDDFNFSIIEMVGINDSLYAIANDPQGKGVFYKVDENGDGYEIIHQFDDTNFYPTSLIANDTIIYGTFSRTAEGGAGLFKYSFDNYSFEIIRTYSNLDLSIATLQHITDSVLWISTTSSGEDFGSIVKIDHDGSNLDRIYTSPGFDSGQDFVDFAFYENSIFIACYNGGGIPYEDGSGTGSTSASGSVVRVDLDGENFEIVIKGEDLIGTQPSSLFIYNDRLVGLFDGAGTDPFGRYFEYDITEKQFVDLGSLDHVGRGNLTFNGEKLYGLTSENFFSIDPATNEKQVIGSFNSSTGRDAVGGPVFLNDKIYIGTQQGGPNGGGTILQWKNDAPILTQILDNILINDGASLTYDLTDYFSDNESDAILFQVTSSNEEVIESILSESTLALNTKSYGSSEISISAQDEWGAETTIDFTIDVNSVPEFTGNLEDHILEKGFGSFEINIANQFDDEDGDELSFSISFSNNDASDHTFENGVLTLNENGSGATSVEVNVTDGRGGDLSVNFQLFIALSLVDIQNIPIYPNPFKEYLFIKNKDFESLKIYNLDGKLIKQYKLTKRENRINLVDLKVGSYVAVIQGTSSEKTIIRKIIKN